MFGLSVQALPMVEVGDGGYLAGGVKLAYHFLLLGAMPKLSEGVDYTGGLDLSASFGGGFRF